MKRVWQYENAITILKCNDNNYVNIKKRWQKLRDNSGNEKMEKWEK